MESCEVDEENVINENKLPAITWEPIPADILFPSELNQHLKDEIKYLVQENTMLKKNVHELEKNVNNQDAQLTEYKLKEQQQNNEQFHANDITRAKIIELSKKLREKSAELLHYKTKCSKLDQSLAIMKQNEADRAESTQVEEKPEKPPESELKLLNDKITHLNSKLFEEKNHALSLKNELKLAVKILQEEVGEPYENIQQLSSNIHWKGRAQVIAELQYKLQESKEKLKNYQDNCNKPSDGTLKKTYFEQKNIKLGREIDSLKGEIEALNKKLDHNRLKIKHIDAECNNWRLKYSHMADQLDKERNLINTVTATHSNSQLTLSENLKRRDRQVEKLQKENKELKLQLKSKECDIENLNKRIQEKEQLTPSKVSQPPNTPNKSLTPNQMDADRLRLLELSKVYSQRVQKEREDKQSLELLYRSERQKAAKLEANLARAKLQESEKTSQSSYASLIARPAYEENVEFKLEIAEEKIKALETRLRIEKTEREQDMRDFSEIVQNYRQ